MVYHLVICQPADVLDCTSTLGQRGTAIDPELEQGARASSLARDLVTFQDHPYQPASSRYMDTDGLGRRPDRTHAPGRECDQSAAARPGGAGARECKPRLALGGRLELALGAGAFWDAIAAMGGRRLRRAGPSMRSTRRSISIRGLWGTGGSRQLHFQGEHYRLDGAQPGPIPAHDIPIWLGALKHRILRLIGRSADGWLPSLGHPKPGEFKAGNSIIDQAAREAGRDPREIRRLVNIAGRFSADRGGFLDGPSAQWVVDLLPLVAEEASAP